MSEATEKRSCIGGVLKDAATDLENTKIFPEFFGSTLAPATSMASVIMPKVADSIPLPFVDEVGAMALSVPINAVKAGYSLIHQEEKGQEAGLEELQVALQEAGVNIMAEYRKLGLENNLPSSETLALFQDQELTFLVEIVGCENLDACYSNHPCNPYVKARFGNQHLHFTKYREKCSDPIYSLRDDALFLWTTTVKDLFLAERGEGGLNLQVWDHASSMQMKRG
jgi:hypothetical protein